MKITIAADFTNKSESEKYVETTLWAEEATKDCIVARTPFDEFTRNVVPAYRRAWVRDDTVSGLRGVRSVHVLREAGDMISGLLKEGPDEVSNTSASARGVPLIQSYASPLAALNDRLFRNLRAKIEVHIDIACYHSDLEEIPWELLRVSIGNTTEHIGLLEDVHIVRRGVPERPSGSPKGSLKCQILNIDMSGSFDEVNALPPPKELQVPSPEDTYIDRGVMTKALKDPGNDYTIFHYFGHGQLNPISQAPELVLKGSNGSSNEEAPFAIEDLISALKNENGELRPSLALAVFVCCDVGISDGWQGFGVNLLHAGIPATISMQAPIQNDAANTFSETLYKELSTGNTIARAVTKARLNIRHLDDPLHSLDWWIPVLHTRSAAHFVFHTLPGPPSKIGVVDKLLGEARSEPKVKYSNEDYLMDELTHCHDVIDSIWHKAEAISETLDVSYRYAIRSGEDHRPEKTKRAYRVLSELLPDSIDEVGDDHPITLSIRTLMCLHACRLHYKKYEDNTLEHLNRLHRDQTRVLRRNHPLTLIVRYLVAYRTGELGDHQQALTLFKELLSDRNNTLGKYHKNSINTHAEIIRCNSELGRTEQANERFEHLRRDQIKRIETLGPNDPDALTTRQDIAYRTGELGDHQQALTLFEQLLPDQINALGENHPDTLTTRYWIAQHTRELGDHQQALTLFEQLLLDQINALGETTPTPSPPGTGSPTASASSTTTNKRSDCLNSSSPT